MSTDEKNKNVEVLETTNSNECKITICNKNINRSNKTTTIPAYMSINIPQINKPHRSNIGF